MVGGQTDSQANLVAAPAVDNKGQAPEKDERVQANDKTTKDETSKDEISKDEAAKGESEPPSPGSPTKASVGKLSSDSEGVESLFGGANRNAVNAETVPSRPTGTSSKGLGSTSTSSLSTHRRSPKASCNRTSSLRSRHSLSAHKASVFRSDSDYLAKKEDYSNLLSAKTLQNLVDHDGHEPRRHIALEPSYPLPLVIFVSLLSIVAGLVVTGVHYAIVYAGCPLGLNGCNSFIPSKESKGFFFLKWFMRVTDNSVPEDVVYIACAILGGSILAALFHWLPEGLAFQIRGGGTIQSLVAVACGERITIQSALFRVLASGIYLGSGGTLGLDGPAIQVCCAATTFLGYVVGMRSVPTQSLLACLGFAGGFAATFNSPLAGILFAMEELQHVSSRLSKHIICVILMCSIVATAVARACQGNQQLLQANWGNELFDSVGGGSLNKVFGKKMWMLVAVPIGVLCSFVGFMCSRSIRFIFDAMDRWRARVPFGLYRHEPMSFIIACALVGSIGSIVFRTTGLRVIWGIGYESLQQAFEREFTASDYLIVAAGKLSAMVLAIVTHAPGDILEPVLISGAFLGGTVGAFLQTIIEDEALASQVLRPCLVFGMVGLFASCFRFPLTPVVIVLELMGVETYSLVLPAALAGFTAITTSNRLFPPLLDELMYEDGIDCHQLSQDADAIAEIEAAEVCLAEEVYEQEPEPEVQEQSTRQSVRIEVTTPIDKCHTNSCDEADLVATCPLYKSSGSSGSSVEMRTFSRTSHASNGSHVSHISFKRRGDNPRRGSALVEVMHHIEASALALSAGEGSQAYYQARRNSGYPQKSLPQRRGLSISGDLEVGASRRHTSVSCAQQQSLPCSPVPSLGKDGQPLTPHSIGSSDPFPKDRKPSPACKTLLEKLVLSSNRDGPGSRRSSWEPPGESSSSRSTNDQKRRSCHASLQNVVSHSRNDPERRSSACSIGGLDKARQGERRTWHGESLVVSSSQTLVVPGALCPSPSDRSETSSDRHSMAGDEEGMAPGEEVQRRCSASSLSPPLSSVEEPASRTTSCSMVGLHIRVGNSIGENSMSLSPMATLQ